jgi:CBS-domain-containing membrane protein
MHSIEACRFLCFRAKKAYIKGAHFMADLLKIDLNASIAYKFKKLWIYYILQSSLAAVSLFFIALLMGQDKMVIISAMGATAFIVFALPTTVPAQTKNVIGGHLVGLAAGGIFYFTTLPYSIEYPLAVGIAIFAMVALDVEHPPAAGTALAVVINEVSPDVFVTVMVSALVLSQCRYFLRHHLKDLI